MSRPVLFVVVLLLVTVHARFAHLYDNESVSFIHNPGVSLSLRNSSLHIESNQRLYLVPSSCRLRNPTNTSSCGVPLNENNAGRLLDETPSESYELLIRRRKRYLLKGQKSNNYSVLVAFDDKDGCWPYLIDNHHDQSFLRRRLCEPDLIVAAADATTTAAPIVPKNDELRTLYNIGVLMIAIDCITFVLYISLIVFMIKLLRNTYEPILQQRQPVAATRRFYLVRGSETEV